jgi:hypothetical protein
MSVFVRGHRVVMAFLSLALFACLAPSHLFAATAVVTPTGTTACKNLTTFNTISAAVTAVPAGSTIYICPGTYAEQVVITKKLTLTGVASNGLTASSALGGNNPVIVSPAGGMIVNSFDLVGSFPTAAQILVENTAGPVDISNIAVDGSNNGLSGCGTDLVGIYYQNASGVVNHVVARYQELDPSDFGCQDGLAIYVQSGYSGGGMASVTIENSSVHDYDKNGITADGTGTVALIESNDVVGIGATPLIAQNGIQLSDGASGKITGNTVTDDVYVNPEDCYPGNCYSATGILLYDSGGTSASHVTVGSNTVSNTQGAVVAITDGAFTADFNDVSLNKITTNAAIAVTGATYLLDGIDLCIEYRAQQFGLRRSYRWRMHGTERRNHWNLHLGDDQYRERGLRWSADRTRPERNQQHSIGKYYLQRGPGNPGWRFLSRWTACGEEGKTENPSVASERLGTRL